ncbi:MAG: efflux RND transporter periplasmic adaptor subunit [Chloroflexi bacterium]|nr:efflux RND transporter periplasmic adaptor subunit [Chloroflexota bacterium]MCH8350052.1 efflux RND transporter periplasmic adaptor subunit [Chloroflexota bacterium]MCI0781539.1 efflux RND transporter periplasmic adaptor subunit [Chloroflexota bacterium]MCI0785824.1 efflux RND transporter periplasmic adaptor subunit [Chloroflexota bacterium]MCI0792536.1 efflux RND transporter periplasmic adaptor subunit [Chloroflexota bacterium]
MSRYLVLGAAGLILAIVGASIFGFELWSKSDLSGRFVSTNDAQVVADLIQVGSINAGRIIDMNVDVGTSVMEGQVIATVDIPAVISRSEITDTSKMGFRDVQDQLTEVVAPRSGLIAARWVKKGDTVSAGQPIVTLMDQRKVWIEANIDEKKIGRVRRGQLVEIEITGRDGKLLGRVETVSPVTAATLRPEQSSSRNLRNVGQVVPVKITLDEDHLSLIPGSSAEITIWVR